MVVWHVNLFGRRNCCDLAGGDAGQLILGMATLGNTGSGIIQTGGQGANSGFGRRLWAAGFR